MLYICMTESEFVRVEMIVYLFLLYQVKECDKLSSQSIYFCFGVNSSLVRTIGVTTIIKQCRSIVFLQNHFCSM